MEVYVNQELLTAAGLGIGSLVVAFIGLLVWAIKHLTSFAKALEAGHTVNASLNDELLSVVKERNQERKQYDQERRDLLSSMEQERVSFRLELHKVRSEAEAANKVLSDELIKIKSKLHTITQEKERLEQRVTELVEQGKAKDLKIAELETKLSNKADKPDTGDVKESAAKVAVETKSNNAQPQTGEHTTPPPEKTTESSEEKND